MKHFINLSLKQARRVVVTVIGATVLIIGIVFIPLPGPGLVGIFAGVAILATEFIWAKRLLKRMNQKAGQVRDTITGTTRPKASDTSK